MLRASWLRGGTRTMSGRRPSTHLQTTITLLPIYGTALAKLVRKNQRIKQSSCFIHAPPDISVVNGRMPDDAPRINQKHGSLRHAFVFDEHAKLTADLVAPVAQ